jgi:hypothetical protein
LPRVLNEYREYPQGLLLQLNLDARFVQFVRFQIKFEYTKANNLGERA